MPPSYKTLLEGPWITPTEVKEYTYCPMIPWLHHYTGTRTEPTPSMVAGKEKADADHKARVAESLGLPRPHRIEVPLEDPRLRLRGIIDVLAGDKTLTVVEVKAYKRPKHRARHYRAQLLAYALLAHNTIGPVRRAILVLGDKPVTYRITTHELEEAKTLIQNLKKTLENEEPPRVRQPKAKCQYCWYRRICPHSNA